MASNLAINALTVVTNGNEERVRNSWCLSEYKFCILLTLLQTKTEFEFWIFLRIQCCMLLPC